MDVFATIVTGGRLIIQYVEACHDYPEEARALKQRANNAHGKLSAADAALLEETSEELDHLALRVQLSRKRIERGGLLRKALNRGTWVARRSGVRLIAEQTKTWRTRLELWLQSLPPGIQAVARAIDASGDQAGPPPIVRSHMSLQEFLTLAQMAKETRAREMLLEDIGELASEIRDTGDISYLPVNHQGQQFVFSSRRVPPDVRPGSQRFDRMLLDMGELAAALNCVDRASGIHLLQIEFYFYHEESRQFFFAQVPPYPVLSMMTLQKVIQLDPFPDTEIALNERLKLAHKLAEAVYFLHSAGFLHKNITSSSVAVLRQANEPSPDMPASFLGDTYLMGFDLIRGTEAHTSKEGTKKTGDEPVRDIWDFDIFQHPERLQGEHSPRYIRTHDVYSLGVVLLEVGLWQPLTEVLGDLELEKVDPSGWTQELLGAAQGLSARVGERYYSLVKWCLSLKGDEIVKSADFAREVLDPLEEMSDAISLDSKSHN